MTVRELAGQSWIRLKNEGTQMDVEITKPFCCDLLSIAMGKAPTGAAWVTVMANINTLAVAVLAEVACIILAEDTQMDEVCLQKARTQGVTVFYSELPVFETAYAIYGCLQ